MLRSFSPILSFIRAFSRYSQAKSGRCLTLWRLFDGTGSITRIPVFAGFRRWWKGFNTGGTVITPVEPFYFLYRDLFLKEAGIFSVKPFYFFRRDWNKNMEAFFSWKRFHRCFNGSTTIIGVLPSVDPGRCLTFGNGLRSLAFGLRCLQLPLQSKSPVAIAPGSDLCVIRGQSSI